VKGAIYKFDFNEARFIFLWTGKYDYRSPNQPGLRSADEGVEAVAG